MKSNLILRAKSIDNDYRIIIKDIVQKSKESFEKNITFKSLSIKSRIQPAYLSRVIALKTHLNSDQLWAICDSLGLSDTETQYMMALGEYQQSTLQMRKKKIKYKIEIYEQKINDIDNIFKSEKHDKVPDHFHLDPLAQLVLQYFFIENHVDDLSIIAQKTNTTQKKINEVIQRLIEYNLIEQKENTYKTKGVQTHLPSHHPLFPHFFKNRLLFPLENNVTTNLKQSIHFSVMFTSDKDFQSDLNQKIKDLLKWSETAIEKHKNKEVYILNIHSHQLSNIQPK